LARGPQAGDSGGAVGTHQATLLLDGAVRLRLQLTVRGFDLPPASSLRNAIQLSLPHIWRCFPSDAQAATEQR